MSFNFENPGIKEYIFEECCIQIETGWNSALPVRQAALRILSSMEEFFESFERPELLEVIRFQEEKVLFPEKRYAVQVRTHFQEDYVKRGLKLAEKYAGEQS